MKYYYMAKLVFRSASKIGHAVWLLNGQRFYNIGHLGPIHFFINDIRIEYCVDSDT